MAHCITRRPGVKVSVHGTAENDKQGDMAAHHKREEKETMQTRSVSGTLVVETLGQAARERDGEQTTRVTRCEKR